jgi:hypothetical protein
MSDGSAGYDGLLTGARGEPSPGSLRLATLSRKRERV